jgi:hypothetical protein
VVPAAAEAAAAAAAAVEAGGEGGGGTVGLGTTTATAKNAARAAAAPPLSVRVPVADAGSTKDVSTENRSSTGVKLEPATPSTPPNRDEDAYIVDGVSEHPQSVREYIHTQHTHTHMHTQTHACTNARTTSTIAVQLIRAAHHPSKA